MKKYLVKIIPILRKYGVKKASLFGSIARGDVHKNSDIDILVDIPKEKSLFEVMDIQFELEKALKRKVDLVEYENIKPRLKPYILKNQIRIL